MLSYAPSEKVNSQKYSNKPRRFFAVNDAVKREGITYNRTFDCDINVYKLASR